MAIRLVHLIDESTREDAARLCSLLLTRLPASEVSQRVIALGALPATLTVPAQVPIIAAGRPALWPFQWALPLQRRLRREQPDVIIAWSVIASACAASARSDGRPAIGVLCDPADARESTRWRSALVKAAVSGFEIICTSTTVQRRLVESGTPVEATAVVRPGVDFAALRRARETMSRDQLDLPPDARVMLTASPPSRAGGQFYGIWATAILHHIWPDAVLVVPGTSREQRRLGRLVEGLYNRQSYRLTADRFSPAELLSVADALLVPALGDVAPGWLAWAMAAGVPVIGSAVPSVAEFITDDHNGFLCKSSEPHALAVRIRTAFESPDVMAQCVQNARHQAYEAFRAERCVEEFLKVIRNAAGGRTALAGVQDAAIDA